LSQQEFEGRSGRWITKIQDYVLEFKPTKLVRGKGVAKLLEDGGILEETHAAEPEEQICVTIEAMKEQGWYKDIISYLQSLSCPPHLTQNQRRSLKL
jgi:hypothetical protein